MSSRRWTPEEEKLLTERWRLVRTTHLAKRLKRSRQALDEKAKRMGLPMGVPRGMVSMPECARKLGLDLRSLEKILKWAQVRICHWSDRFRYIDLIDAEDALLRWDNEAETVLDASKRLGLRFEHVRDAVISADIGWRKHERVLKTDIDRFVQAYDASRLSVRELAPRLGVSRSVLTIALRNAGLIEARRGTRGPRARLHETQAREALARYQATPPRTRRKQHVKGSHDPRSRAGDPPSHQAVRRGDAGDT